MKITFYAHASFRLEGDGLAVVTDPYTPGPQGSGYEPIDEAADIVLMSSTTDPFHSDPSHVLGNPAVVDTLTLPEGRAEVKGLQIRSFPAMENLQHDFGRDPDANAMYLFALGGVRVLHMGDVGNTIAPEQIDALRGQVDVLLALAGAHATIAFADLDAFVEAIGPRVVIPMHYWHPRGVLNIAPVDEYLARHPADTITRVGATSLELTPEALPSATQIYVMEQSR